MRCSLLIFSILLASFSVQAQQWFPKYKDAYWTESIPSSMRQDYVYFGKQYQGKSWSDLPNSAFAEYKKTGNRSHYESLLFEKRRQLAALVMAEIVDGKGQFIPDIIKGLQSTLKETWWGVPAHYDSDVPKKDNQIVDLINAETASLLAYTRYVLSSEINRISPSLLDLIDSEISRRVLQPAVSKDYWWKRAVNNWNPWICSNWLACVLFCEHDATRKSQAINQINEACRVFIDGFPDDGGCDEGPMYWDRSSASLFEVCYLLSMSHNQVPIDFNHPKLRAMGSYIYRMYAGNGFVINFSDTYSYRAKLNINICYPFGLLTGDKVLCQYSAWFGEKYDELRKPAQLFNSSGNWPSLGRELIFLNHIQSFLKEEPREPLIQDVWIPSLQLMTARTSSQSSLFIAYKGGNNGENHNHNDVGSFIVYTNGEPLLIDIGVAEYTAKTFSDDRYEIWSMQSDYHNLPRINGYSQCAGKQYLASVIEQKAGQLTLDISKAYPEEANIIRWNRTVSTHSRYRIKVKEEFELASYDGQSQIMLITPIEPILAGEGRIKLNSVSIQYKSSQLNPVIEEISSLLDPALSRVWGQKMYRIILNVRSQKLRQRIRYTIAVN